MSLSSHSVEKSYDGDKPNHTNIESNEIEKQNEETLSEDTGDHLNGCDDDIKFAFDETKMFEVCDGVKKVIIKEGKGTIFPSPNVTCFVNYRAWVESNYQVVFDTWSENQPLELVLGKEKDEHKGLAKGVESMLVGEKSVLKVSSNLAYGEKGNFSFPHVPPSTDLIYEVELIAMDSDSKGRLRSEMFVEERITAAERRKNEGNLFFKDNMIDEAIRQYEMALGYINDEFMYQMYGKYVDMANNVRFPCLLNLAACMLHSKRYDNAISHCDTVLSDDANNLKALFRRGKAKSLLGRTEEAKEDFEKARKLSPSDKAIHKELFEIKLAEKEALEKQRKLFKGIFQKPEPRAEPKPVVKKGGILGLWQWIVSVLNIFWPFTVQKIKSQ